MQVYNWGYPVGASLHWRFVELGPFPREDSTVSSGVPEQPPSIPALTIYATSMNFTETRSSETGLKRFCTVVINPWIRITVADELRQEVELVCALWWVQVWIQSSTQSDATSSL